jgi:hypothetical protein
MQSSIMEVGQASPYILYSLEMSGKYHTCNICNQHIIKKYGYILIFSKNGQLRGKTKFENSVGAYKVQSLMKMDLI